MQPSALSLFLGLVIHLGQYSVIVTNKQFNCNLRIVERIPITTSQHTCQGPFPCTVHIYGRILYSLRCSHELELSAGFFIFYCDGVCPNQQTNFTDRCSIGDWYNSIYDVCLSKETSTLSSPVDGVTDDPLLEDQVAASWMVIGIILGSLIFSCIILVAMRMCRKRGGNRSVIRRMRENYQRQNQTTSSPTNRPTSSATNRPESSPTNRPSSSITNRPTSSPTDRPTISPTMIYSVTLDCGPGQALSQSNNDYMRRTSQQRERDLDRDLDRDPEANTPSCPVVVTKPPSYEEVIRADNNEENKDIPNPNPPPYSE